MRLARNEKRTRRRQECRLKLVTHIYNRLGLEIQPNRVRLQPRPEDGYAWWAAEGFEHLLKKSLSSGSIGVYMSIMENLGRSIAAIDPNTLHGMVPSDNDTTKRLLSQSKDRSFTPIIRHLECQNRELNTELENALSLSDALSARIEKWERWAQVMEDRLRESQTRVYLLDEELQGGTIAAERLLQNFRITQAKSYSTEYNSTLRSRSEEGSIDLVHVPLE